MEIIPVIGIIALVVMLSVITRKLALRSTKRKALEDIESLVKNREQRAAYTYLVGRIQRLEWLKKNYRSIWKVSKREKNSIAGIVTQLDMRVLNNVFQIQTTDEALNDYRRRASTVSLDYYQEFINENNASLEAQYQQWREETRLEQIRRDENFRRAAAAEAKREQKIAEASIKHWNSLSPQTQEEFKNTKGKRERLKVLGDSDDYIAATMAPIIMSSFFPGVNPNSSYSIVDCEYNSSYNSYTDYSSNDSGSSYSDSGSSYSDSSSSYSDGGSSFSGGGDCF